MWMSWKCALTGLPYGGAKGGIACDPRTLSNAELENLTRRFTQEMILFIGPQIDVMAPDLGTNEQIMAWMMDTYSMMQGRAVPGVVTGKPLVVGGSFGRREATGRGIVHVLHEAARRLRLELRGCRVIVQGFGNVGAVAARLLAQDICLVVGVADINGAVWNGAGLDIPALERHVAETGTIVVVESEDPAEGPDLLTAGCDILIPAATASQIRADNAAAIKARLVIEAANGPTTPEADVILADRGVTVVPDILANSGGVVVSYFEWVQGLQHYFWKESEVISRLQEIMARAFTRVWQTSQKGGVDLRTGALMEGVSRVADAHVSRGLYP